MHYVFIFFCYNAQCENFVVVKCSDAIVKGSTLLKDVFVCDFIAIYEGDV